MRSCAVCFWYQGDHQSGTCYNRPPQSYTIRHEPDDNGRVELETFAVRPPVLPNEYCSFFSHRSTNRTDQSGRQKQEMQK